ncbi:ADP-ribosylglycohydrolase family protein [Pseudomonas syringae]|uniref:ADP-ribosylglycohydrolase family protein n=1 Tax=Pseudomonas syringae TaxID=317 RepID=UPI003F74D165
MRPNLENSIINSALWAASGDALGWITELTDKKGVVRRTGKAKVTRTVPWKRKVGGIAGVTVELPEGTYSDDTQLRLAVCRSIQGDGFFDVEAFAKVELSTWASYALGGGRGTKVAASNISKRDVNWFSNFYSQSDQIYTQGGGNGAAMRIQPHVWRRARGSKREYLTDVIRDSLVTHGHMRGVCGAVFHADCLAYTLDTGELPGPREWMDFISGFDEIFTAVKEDYQLGKFWLGPWEQASKTDLRSAIDQVAEEMRRYMPFLGDFRISVESSYLKVLESLECFTTRVGTGTNTALAAAYLAWVGQDQEIDTTLNIAVNALGSDTDTIGTMVGALLGSISMTPPKWVIQDEQYIRSEAIRMVRIAEGRKCDGFRYPDLISWQPPSSQSNALSIGDRGYVLGAFGALEPIGKSWTSGPFTWEWFTMPFGQTILCKRRSDLKLASAKQPDNSNYSNLDSLLSDNASSEKTALTDRDRNRTFDLPLFSTIDSVQIEVDDFDKALNKRALSDLPEGAGQAEYFSEEKKERSIAELTDAVIKSNFASDVIGKCFLECVARDSAIENAIAFSAIIAKAIDVRQKKTAR